VALTLNYYYHYSIFIIIMIINIIFTKYAVLTY